MSKPWAQAWIILLLLVAAGLRFTALEAFPPGLHYDEAANALLAGDIGLRGERPVFIPSYTGKEVFFFYLAGGLMALLGESIFALRLASATLGLLTIAATYRFGTSLFKDRRIGLIAALLLTLHFQHLLFSRLGFRAISQPLLQVLTVWWLFVSFERWASGVYDRLSPILAGIFLGLTAYTYLAARLFPVVLIFGLGMLLWRAWRSDRALSSLVGRLLLSGGVGVAVLAPLLNYFRLNRDAFWVRIGQVGQSAAADALTPLEGIGRTLLMLFWPGAGDPYQRFNLPGMPLFSLFLALFALVGLSVLVSSLWGGRRVARLDRPGVTFGFAILLVGPPIMLLPSALATGEIVPSNLRAIGLLPFLLFWPAVGLVTVWDRVADRLRSRNGADLSFVWLPLALLIGLTPLTGLSYFVRWGGRADVYLENDGPMLALADHLNRGVADGPVLVSSRFAPHPTLAFGTDRYERVVYLPRSEALLFPVNQSEEVEIYFPADSPPAGWMTRFLGEATVESGDFVSYNLTKPEIAPSIPADTQFGYAVRLLGYDLPAQSPSGEEIGITLYWEMMGAPGFDMTLFAHLEDDRGGRWGQVETRVYDPALWQSGDLLIQRVALPIRPGTPPDAYQLRIGWFDPASGQGVARFNAAGRFAGDALVIEQLPVAAPPIPTVLPAPAFPIDVEVRPGLDLLGYEAGKRTLTRGEPLWVSLWWLAAQPQPEMTLRFELRQGADGVILANSQPVYGRLPFERWSTPSFVIDHQAPGIPVNQASGVYDLYLRVLAADNSTLYFGSLGGVTVEDSDIRFEPPARPDLLRSDAVFGQEIALYGYQPPTAANDYQLSLEWQAFTRPSADYTTFVHLLNLDGSCCVWQQDLPAGGPERPTSLWLENEFISDLYQLELPADLPAGNYPLEIGLYLPNTAQRLAVTASAKHGEDYLFLRDVEVGR